MSNKQKKCDKHQNSNHIQKKKKGQMQSQNDSRRGSEHLGSNHTGLTSL